MKELNEKVAWLRKERGITLGDLAGMFNNLTGSNPGSKLYQNGDKIFTYERKTNPVKIKPEVIAAYCKVFGLTEDELLHRDLLKLNLKQRWQDLPINIVEEPAAAYGSAKEIAELKLLLVGIDKKLDDLLKRKK